MIARRYLVGAVIGGLVLLLAVWLRYGIEIESAFRYRVRYELPEGFSGWVTVTVSEPTCPPVRSEGRTLVYPIDEHGQGCTSTPVMTGWRKVEYEEVLPGGARRALPKTGWGSGGRIWGGSVGRLQVLGNPPAEYERFFVGPEEELRGGN